VTTEAPTTTPLRVVFFLNRFTYIRFFESVLRALVERGHEVVLLVERDPTHDYEEQWAEELDRDPRFSWRRTRSMKRDPLREFRRGLRKTVDYLHFVRPRFEHAPALTRRARNRAPALVVRLSRLPVLRSEPMLRLATRLLESFDHAVPTPAALLEELKELDPDLVVVAPHGMPGSLDSEYLKAAKALGVPAAIAVASWDNLSSKQLLHVQPHRLLVWNEIQKREAIELHGIPGDRVVVTGAQNFDLWFDWQPSARDDFCRRLGLDPDRPYVLYVGGSLYPGEITEAEWARRWVAALKASEVSVLASAGVLLRPHPCRIDEWLDVPYDDYENVALWRCEYREMPVTPEARAEFFDSIYHSAAVVGLNTSAMIEAAIVGRSVHTVIAAEFETSQRGVFHFEYLLNVGGGLPRVAHSLAEHFSQLAETLQGADEAAGERRRRFLEEFVRPHGLERPATPIFIETLEQLAQTSVDVERAPRWFAAVEPALLLAIRSREIDSGTPARVSRKLARLGRKQRKTARKLAKRMAR